MASDTGIERGQQPLDQAVGFVEEAKISASRAPQCGPCTECGTATTPLWRDGPHGPRTLCNACGVRRNRERRKKGRTAHKVTTMVTTRSKRARTVTAEAGHYGPKESIGKQIVEDAPDQATNTFSGVSGSGASDGSILQCALLPESFAHQSTSSPVADRTVHQSTLPAAVQDSTSARRPLRKAALASMMSTKRISHKGPFISAMDTTISGSGRRVPNVASRVRTDSFRKVVDGRVHTERKYTTCKTTRGSKAERHFHLMGSVAKRKTTTTPYSRAARGVNSLKALQNIHRTEPQPSPDWRQRVKEPKLPDVMALGQECTAAIQLLSMRYGADAAKDNTHLVPTLNHLLESVLPKTPSEAKLLLSHCLLKNLPDDKIGELQKIEDELLQARWDVHAAEVAASAVAKSLAARTAAVAQARAKYAQTCTRLEEFMAGTNCISHL